MLVILITAALSSIVTALACTLALYKVTVKLFEQILSQATAIMQAGFKSDEDILHIILQLEERLNALYHHRANSSI